MDDLKLDEKSLMTSYTEGMMWQSTKFNSFHTLNVNPVTIRREH